MLHLLHILDYCGLRWDVTKAAAITSAIRGADRSEPPGVDTGTASRHRLLLPSNTGEHPI